MSNNQSLLQKFDLVEELNEQDAETISGGYEVFTITNKTNYDITYTLDGKEWLHKPNESWTWTAYKGGNIKFDTDGRNDYNQSQSHNLSNGGVYEFQNNNYTAGNPYDLDLYRVG